MFSDLQNVFQKSPKDPACLFVGWCGEVTGACLLRCLFGSRLPCSPSKAGIRLVGVFADWAGAPLRHYTLQQSGRLPNKQMKSTERRFLVPSEMWLRQMQRWHPHTWHSVTTLLCLHSQLHFDLFRKTGREVGEGDTAHMITHKIMFVSSNSGVTV